MLLSFFGRAGGPRLCDLLDKVYLFLPIASIEKRNKSGCESFIKYLDGSVFIFSGFVV